MVSTEKVQLVNNKCGLKRLEMHRYEEKKIESVIKMDVPRPASYSEYFGSQQPKIHRIVLLNKIEP